MAHIGDRHSYQKKETEAYHAASDLISERLVSAPIPVQVNSSIARTGSDIAICTLMWRHLSLNKAGKLQSRSGITLSA